MPIIRSHTSPPTEEIVINWHLIEKCNYRCHYCFAKWHSPTTAEIWRSEERTDRFLADLWSAFKAGCPHPTAFGQIEWSSARLSLAGGEPTLLRSGTTEICRKATRLGFEVSLISNGSLMTEGYIRELAPHLTMLGLSIDSVDVSTNQAIGRAQLNGVTLAGRDYHNIIKWARQENPDLMIKLNTVVNAINRDKCFSDFISRARPDRWKVLRMLPILSTSGQVTDNEFRLFVQRHQHHATVMSVEYNSVMTQSYIMIDPYGRFFQNAPCGGGYIYSDPIEECGCSTAFSQVPFDLSKFRGRYALLQA